MNNRLRQIIEYATGGIGSSNLLTPTKAVSSLLAAFIYSNLIKFHRRVKFLAISVFYSVFLFNFAASLDSI